MVNKTISGGISMKSARKKMRQLVDWSAAFWAGLISGAASFILCLLFSGVLVTSPWFYTRLVSSLIFGSQILITPSIFDLGYLLIGLAIHLIIAMLIAMLIAIIVHKYGILVSVVGGAVIGLAVYAIGFYSFSRFFPWLVPFRSSLFLAEFFVYGALAGGLYEAMEVEVFVPEGSHQL
jgi:hypothetical protein